MHVHLMPVALVTSWPPTAAVLRESDLLQILLIRIFGGFPEIIPHQRVKLVMP